MNKKFLCLLGAASIGMSLSASSMSKPTPPTEGHAPLSTLPSANQNAQTVKGTVVDANGEAIIGASVQVKGTTIGTITDFDGNFTLDVPENAVLRISYIGFITQDISVKNKKDFKIKPSTAGKWQLTHIPSTAYLTWKEKSFRETYEFGIVNTQK